MLFHQQIRGVIAMALLLAVIPFFVFFNASSEDFHGPILSTSEDNKIAVEVLSQPDVTGIYFIEEGATLQDLLHQIDSEIHVKQNIPLKNAMSVKLHCHESLCQAVAEKMASAERLALGLPVDINRASQDELMLIPGIGKVMAEKIVVKRNAVERFDQLEQLMEIRGIKEKKLSQLLPYLCIE